MPEPPHFGRTLCQLRDRRGLDTPQAARVLKSDLRTLRKYERADHFDGYENTLFKIITGYHHIKPLSREEQDDLGAALPRAVFVNVLASMLSLPHTDQSPDSPAAPHAPPNAAKAAHQVTDAIINILGASRTVAFLSDALSKIGTDGRIETSWIPDATQQQLDDAAMVIGRHPTVENEPETNAGTDAARRAHARGQQLDTSKMNPAARDAALAAQKRLQRDADSE